MSLMARSMVDVMLLKQKFSFTQCSRLIQPRLLFLYNLTNITQQYKRQMDAKPNEDDEQSVASSSSSSSSESEDDKESEEEQRRRLEQIKKAKAEEENKKKMLEAQQKSMSKKVCRYRY